MKRRLIFQCVTLGVIVVYVLLLLLIVFSSNDKLQDKHWDQWEQQNEKLLK